MKGKSFLLIIIKTGPCALPYDYICNITKFELFPAYRDSVFEMGGLVVSEAETVEPFFVKF